MHPTTDSGLTPPAAIDTSLLMGDVMRSRWESAAATVFAEPQFVRGVKRKPPKRRPVRDICYTGSWRIFAAMPAATWRPRRRRKYTAHCAPFLWRARASSR
jgi:hypothetical protein